MNRHVSSTMAVFIMMSACAPHHDWDNIDYSSVYRKAAGRENDTSYSAPRVIGCVDEDLYNCK